jgi:DNA-binding TFAR19-related protein (PDSD5 family)
MSRMRTALVSLSLSLLAACGREIVRETPPPPAAPPVNVIAVIRDGAAEYRGEFHVEVIRDADITHAIEEASRAEMRGDRRAAEEALRGALDDPEARQRYAELLLARGQAAEAERLAREAWEAGAKVGEWCARSWLTVAEARRMQNAPHGAEQARERARDCMPPKVERY